MLHSAMFKLIALSNSPSDHINHEISNISTSSFVNGKHFNHGGRKKSKSI